MTSLLVFFLFVFVNTGKIFWFPPDAMPSVLMELALFFFLLVIVMWSHSQISWLMQKKALQELPSLTRSVIEGFLVIVSTLIFNYLIIFAPLIYIIGVEDLPEGRIRTVLVISSILSLFFYYFVERERSRKKLQMEFLRSEQLQKENFRAQLNALKSQMNPHFLFNSLNVLASLIYVDKTRAADFTRQLAHIYRSFLENSEKTVVSLQEEMELVGAYVSLLHTRFGKDLQIEIEIPASKEHFLIPPGAVQLLIENAIKHNGFNRRKPLLVSIFTEGDHLVIRNNRHPRKEAVRSGGHGLQNIKNRYQFLTDKEVVIQGNEQQFLVKLPLLKPGKNENYDHRR